MLLIILIFKYLYSLMAQVQAVLLRVLSQIEDNAVAAVSLSDISSDTASNILQFAELEDSSDIKVGQQVVAIGEAMH